MHRKLKKLRNVAIIPKILVLALYFLTAGSNGFAQSFSSTIPEGNFTGGQMATPLPFASHSRPFIRYPDLYLILKHSRARLLVKEYDPLRADKGVMISKYKGKFSMEEDLLVVRFKKVKYWSGRSKLRLARTGKIVESDRFGLLTLSTGFVSDAQILHLADSTRRVQFTLSPLNRHQFKKSMK
ncbi:MAG: hypothetical protein H6606_00470 [Flavobacteriales bacterium]|nr:hypothetical protein [Flavobacteriales bacterium]